MSASRIILTSLPSFCQNYQNWWKFDKVLTKAILHSFLRHGVERWYIHAVLRNNKLMRTE